MVSDPARSSSTSRIFTNWFGNSAPSRLSNTALAFTVPVVVSISLSTVSSVPVPSLVACERSYASATSLRPLRTSRSTSGN